MKEVIISLLFSMNFQLFAQTKPTVDIEAVLSELAEPLQEEVLFYRWQSTVSGENLHKIGKMTEQLDKHFMAMQMNTVAGPGIYMAGHPESSSSYLPKEGGNLIEVRIKKGTPFLNLQDPEVIERLKERGLNPSKVMGEKIKSPIVMMYSRDWYVGKNLQDKARFEMFPGPSHDAASFKRIYSDLYYDGHAADQAFEQMKTRRPEVLKIIGENPASGDYLAARVAPSEKMLPLIRQLIDPYTFFANNVIRTFLAMPDKGQVIFTDPVLAKTVKEKLISSAGDHDFARIVKYFPEDWAVDFTLQSQEPATFLARYLEKINDISDEEFVKRVTKFERILKERGRSGFTVDMKKHLEASLEERIAKARQKRKSISSLMSLVESDFVRESSLSSIEERMVKAESYRRSFEQAFKAKDRSSFSQLLNETEGVSDLGRVIDESGPEDLKVLKSVLSEDPKLYSRHLGEKEDITKIVKVSEALKKIGVDVTQANLDHFLEVGSKRRNQFLVKCLESDSCRPRLSGKWDKLLVGISDLEAIGGAVRKINDRQIARAVEKEIFMATTSAQQMSSFARAIFIRTRRDILFEKMKQIGFHNFRPKELDHMVPIGTLSAAEQKTTLGVAIQGAINAEDAIYLKKVFVENGLHKTELIRVLVRKMDEMNPTLEEVEKFESLGKVMGLRAKPSQNFDCFSNWAKTLGR